MITALTRTGPPPEGLIICAPPQSPTHQLPIAHPGHPAHPGYAAHPVHPGHQAVMAISARPFQHPRPSAVNHLCHHDSHNNRPGSQPAILAPLNRQERRLISTTTPRPAATSATAEPASLLTASDPIILGPVQQLLPKIYYQRITPELPHIAHVCSKIILMSPERAFNHRII